MINQKIGLPIEFMDDYKEILKQLTESNTMKQICQKIETLIELKKHLRVNANNNLLIDQLILSFQEVGV